MVAKEGGKVIDITWPPSNPRAVHSGLTVSGEILERLRPCLESGKVKAVVDPNGPFDFSDVIEAFRYLETGRARGKVVVSGFPSSCYIASATCYANNGFCNTKLAPQKNGNKFVLAYKIENESE